jgi:hypothetical protein
MPRLFLDLVQDFRFYGGDDQQELLERHPQAAKAALTENEGIKNPGSLRGILAGGVGAVDTSGKRVGLEVRLCVTGLDTQARARHARSSWSELRGLVRNRCRQALYSQFTAATQADQRHAASIEAVHTFRVGFDGARAGGFNERRFALGGRGSPPFSGFCLDFTQSSHLLDALPSNQLDTFCAVLRSYTRTHCD